MLLQLKSIFMGEKTALPFDIELDFSSLDWQGICPFQKPVSVKGAVTASADVVTLKADVRYTYDGPCDRCAETMSEERNFTVEHTLVTSLDNEDKEEFLVIENFQLDLEELMQTEFLLNLPMKNLCKPDCKGICMTCGKNLNQGLCGCRQETVDPRLEILKQLID